MSKKQEPRYLRVKVFPKSGRSQINGWLDVPNQNTSSSEKTLKVHLKAAPEKGQANAELLKLLADHFKIRKEQIHIISGAQSRLKLIKYFSKKET